MIRMSFSLYRKYRPQSFGDVVGQEPIITTLLQQSATGTFAHAYVFTGPRGIGKTTTARLLAKAANCESPKKNGEPCNGCRACKLINESKAIDIVEIDAASHTGVDHVRSVVIDTSRTAPSTLKKKVFIIDEVHMLSSSAFNALLKTLEEPPEHAMFILATTEVHKVPETILSRCQRYAFRRISVDVLVKRLQEIAKKEKIEVAQSVLQEVARRSEGSSRDAESLLGQLMAFGDAKITAEQAAIVLPRSSFLDVSELIHAILQGDVSSALSFISSFAEDGGSCDQLFIDTILYVRYLLLERLGSDKLRDMISSKLPDVARKTLAQDAVIGDVRHLVRLLEVLLGVKRNFWYREIEELPLELAVCQFCDAPDQTPKKEIIPPPASHHLAANPKPQQKIQTDAKELRSRENPANSTGAVSLSLVKEKWQLFVNSIRVQNHSLSVSMQITLPLHIVGSTLTIVVPYAFHKDRLCQMSTRKYLEERLSDFFGTPLTLQVEVSSTDAVGKSDNLAPVKLKENLWDQIVDAFGEELAPNG